MAARTTAQGHGNKRERSTERHQEEDAGSAPSDFFDTTVRAFWTEWLERGPDWTSNEERIDFAMRVTQALKDAPQCTDVQRRRIQKLLGLTPEQAAVVQRRTTTADATADYVRELVEREKNQTTADPTPPVREVASASLRAALVGLSDRCADRPVLTFDLREHDCSEWMRLYCDLRSLLRTQPHRDGTFLWLQWRTPANRLVPVLLFIDLNADRQVYYDPSDVSRAFAYESFLCGESSDRRVVVDFALGRVRKPLAALIGDGVVEVGDLVAACALRLNCFDLQSIVDGLRTLPWDNDMRQSLARWARRAAAARSPAEIRAVFGLADDSDPPTTQRRSENAAHLNENWWGVPLPRPFRAGVPFRVLLHAHLDPGMESLCPDPLLESAERRSTPLWVVRLSGFEDLNTIDHFLRHLQPTVLAAAAHDACSLLLQFLCGRSSLWGPNLVATTRSIVRSVASHVDLRVWRSVYVYVDAQPLVLVHNTTDCDESGVVGIGGSLHYVRLAPADLSSPTVVDAQQHGMIGRVRDTLQITVPIPEPPGDVPALVAFLRKATTVHSNRLTGGACQGWNGPANSHPDSIALEVRRRRSGVDGGEGEEETSADMLINNRCVRLTGFDAALVATVATQSAAGFITASPRPQTSGR